MSSGKLAASGIVSCDLNSVDITGSCYSSSTFFTTPVPLITVDWGTAFGSSLSNPGTNPSSGPWTTTIGGISISLNVGSDFTGAESAQLARADNTEYVWDGSHWVAPANMILDPGHFGAPSNGTPMPTGSTGDHLVELYTGQGSLVISFSQGISSAGLLMSTLSTLYDTDFRGTIEALDSGGAVLGIYGINTTGVGGLCAGLYDYPLPEPCNNAPFVGIQAPGNRDSIYSLVITATSGEVLLAPVLDSLEFEQSGLPDLPEPATAVLMGCGFLAIAHLRKRAAQRR